MKQFRDGRFGYVLKHAQYALRQAMDGRLTEVDLTTPQYAALSALEQDNGLSNAEVARRCFVTPQTMHSIVTRLEEAGLLRRTPDPDHGRIQQLHLTDEGTARLEQAHDVVDEIEKQMTAGIPADELEQAKSVLVRCVATLTDG